MTGNEIRSRFLKFFQDHGHTVVPSSALIPHNDPTLLFINAGMNQFKDVFLGREKRDYVRATSAQKCVRAGGKHNDLENVGQTARHHTFFEMLGNFSFGDYFKKEAIDHAWKFLTEEMGLPKDKLWVTVFREDDEAYDIWRDQQGIPEERLIRMGEKDNFWSMGDTGPCGPCSEILIDQGESMSCGDECGIGKCDCDRYLELWNLVFMQFNRDADGTMTPLPKPSIDTGMGLERITAVMQGVQSNYDCDLLRGIIAHVEELSGKRYGDNAEHDMSMRVIADHSRATAFLIADGVLPSNEGRGYVLRRIMRRAARHAKMLGFADPVLYRTATFVLQSMAEAYPEPAQRADYVAKIVKIEEERFIQTLDNGLRILTEEVERLKAANATVLPGDVAFKLYDTFGFPLDLTADILRGENVTIDEDGFEACMEEQRQKAREHWKGSGEEAISGIYRQLAEEGARTDFTGYGELTGQSEILAILLDGQPVSSAPAGAKVEIVTAATPFYGESGGQTGDCGTLAAGDAEVTITDTKKPLPELFVHVGEIAAGTLQTGETATLTVDRERRQATALNHTATHLLQAALVEVLGEHVKQAGSLVTPERLRFDFIHFSAMSAEELERVETLVNCRIRENAGVDTREMDHEQAVAEGATALFGEKYGDKVRVVRVGDISMELCGGTHANASGDIGLFKILQETGIAAGVRRIEAVTGAKALQVVRDQERTLDDLASLIKTDRPQLEARLRKLLERQKELEREIESLQGKLNADQAGDLLQQATEIDGISVVCGRVDNLDGKALRELADQVRDRLSSGVLILGSAHEGKAGLLVAVTKDLTKRLQAGALVKQLAAMVGGGGGGRPDLAQAGGSKPEQLDEALASVPQRISEALNAA
ncbi:alanyl-tRNA synthetase [Syntrophotalea carbinolica DSM 2380]|uniref:Alanine--tRNA ligase n=1 Tax=Syntrophotalea carbinolica (strain DSM 2380 / NBRC 103641 / GraBd1) TaxID=338963 RepID=SYA_SYNC1|nr:alanine--tRNA ligase [Syntrophotalea carbinolica]Q3A1W0.2 RecName: Full=Alanine--tRNA ligase; AltName: Full=Alanyl-tRNA synthetase; Short=AlaRS [Syntrophotalea carbinolica DSM 2380]ABA89647.2 alanyl-tRNA synthetase [Syntrophotalea carbinolica DSM 2380]